MIIFMFPWHDGIEAIGVRGKELMTSDVRPQSDAGYRCDYGPGWRALR
jgi:hypothetical protein